MNPYWGKNFFGFFGTLFWHIFHPTELALDEIQLLVLIGVALSCALVGPPLVLRRMSMLANSISHTILLGIVIAYLMVGAMFGAMLLAAFLAALLTALLTEFLRHTAGLRADASNGIVFSTLFALGIVLTTLKTRNLHIGLDAVMGNADALHRDDIALVAWIFLGNLLLTLLFFKEQKAASFEPQTAQYAQLFHYLLMVQVSATVVAAFRAVGVVMVLALLVGPALAARNVTRHLWSMMTMAALIGALSALFAVALGRHILTVYGVGLSTGGLVVCVVALFYGCLLLCRQQ